MIRSMTGYAKAEHTSDTFAITTEIRTLNSRHLDINIRMPHRYIAFEEKIKRFIKEKLDRGRVEISIRIKEETEAAYVYEANLLKACAFHKAILQLNDHLKLKSQLSIDHLLNIDGIITPADPKIDLDALWSELKTCLEITLAELITMRAAEGKNLAEDLLERIALLEKHIQFIGDASTDLLSYYQNRLKERIEKLTEGLIEIEPFRIAQEAAFLADRSDVSEEIVRIGSHLKQLHQMINTTEPAGSKINFIIQELNREFNTLGSKTGNTDVSHKVVELKSELEKMREQVQNIE